MKTQTTKKEKKHIISFLKKQIRDDKFLKLLLTIFKDTKKAMKKNKTFKNDDLLINDMYHQLKLKETDFYALTTAVVLDKRNK